MRTSPSERSAASIGRRAIAGVTSVTVLLLQTSCSIFVPPTQEFSISSEPPGAEVFINGRLVGATPLVTRISRKTPSAIMVRKEKYQTVTRQTSRTLSATGILDVIGVFVWIVPGIGLFFPGAYEQTPSNMTVVLPSVASSK